VSDLPKRLRSSVGYGAVNGDPFERNVCEKQMLEAASAIEGLEVQISRALAVAQGAGELLSAVEEILSYSGGAGSALENGYVMDRLNTAIQKVKDATNE